MSTPHGRSDRLRVICLALFALTIAGYRALGAAFYGGFRVGQGSAMNHLPADELAHYGLFFACGLLAAVLAFLALDGLPLVERAARAVAGLCDRRAVVWLAMGAVVLATATLSSVVLGHAVTTDDEHTYRFIARTLLDGGVVAASPGADLAFFREQFVVLDERVRFGKYPIGHPLLLALGQAAGLEAMVVPLLTALAVVPLHVVATRLAGRRVAGLACLLYAASPQVWFTGATYLSQPASSLALVTGLALLVGREPGRAPAPWALAAAGACFGFGVVVRPLPGALFAAAAMADVVSVSGPAWRARLARSLAFAMPAAALASIVPLTNYLQNGSALVSGYQAFHAPGQGIGSVMGGGFAMAAMSVAASVIRLNFWLFGWPLSVVPSLLAGRLARPWLLWGVLGSELVYRVIAPKAGVGGTGPIYLFEAVPVLCLLSAMGLARVARGGLRFLGGGARDALAPALVAASMVAFALFVPPKLADLGRMGYAQREVERLIAQRDLRSALVFHEGVVPYWAGLTWAYYPRVNGPRLDDDVLFLLLQREGGLARNVDFWRRRYPERTAWYFAWPREGGPMLVELSEYVRLQALQPDQVRGGGPVPHGP